MKTIRGFLSLSLIFLSLSSLQVFADPLEDKLNQLNSWYEKGLIDAADYARSKTDLLKTFTENQRLVLCHN